MNDYIALLNFSLIQVRFVGRLFLASTFAIAVPPKIVKFPSVLNTILERGITTDYAEFLLISAIMILIVGSFLLVFSYFTMAFFQSISFYYLSIMILGLGFGMTRPALSSSLSLAQSPENQGSAAGYLGSVIPIGHMTTPFIAMPIYAINPAYLYLSLIHI